MQVPGWLHFARALRSQPYARLWMGQTISMLGNYAFIPMLGWQTLQLTHSAAATAIVETAAMIPMALFLLFGGVAADRLPRRLIMLLSDTGCGIAALCIALLSLMHRLEFWHLVALVAFFGICSGFFSPAYRSIRPELVEKELLTSANALDGMSRQIGRLVGPSLSIVFIALAGLPLVFAFDGLTFLFSALCLLMVRMPASHAKLEQKASDMQKPSGIRQIFADIQEGVRYIRQVAWLGVGIVVFAIATTGTASSLIVALPKLVQIHYNTGVWLLGMIFTLQALGYILAMLLVGHIRHRRGIFAFTAALVHSICVVALGLPVPFLIHPLTAMIACLILGLNGGLCDTLWTTLQQEYVPSDKLGRVSSIDLFSSFCLWPLGYAIVGKVADTIDPGWAFVATGCIGIILYGSALSFAAIRRLQ